MGQTNETLQAMGYPPDYLERRSLRRRLYGGCAPGDHQRPNQRNRRRHRIAHRLLGHRGTSGNVIPARSSEHGKHGRISVEPDRMAYGLQDYPQGVMPKGLR